MRRNEQSAPTQWIQGGSVAVGQFADEDWEEEEAEDGEVVVAGAARQFA